MTSKTAFTGLEHLAEHVRHERGPHQVHAASVHSDERVSASPTGLILGRSRSRHATRVSAAFPLRGAEG